MVNYINTQLDKVKEIAIAFLYLDITPCGYGLVQHPYFESEIVNSDNEMCIRDRGNAGL